MSMVDPTPKFAEVDTGLWQWRTWTITAVGRAFWLLTPASREFGPYTTLDDAVSKVKKLLFLEAEDDTRRM